MTAPFLLHARIGKASPEPVSLRTDCDIGAVAALVADPTRATMLLSLLDGRLRPASELARLARVSPATASEHLAKLAAGGLIVPEPHGRFRYYRLASARVAEALESLATLARPNGMRGAASHRHTPAIHRARLCYDHLAGALGVGLTDALVAAGALRREDRSFVLAHNGVQAFTDLGLDLDAVGRGPGLRGRACLDWTERRYHLAGPLGTALASRLFELDWIERTGQTRALRITNAGRRALKERFGLQLF